MATRRERVIFEAVDNYTGDVAKMAAVTKLFQRELNSVDSDTARFQRSVDALSQKSLPDMSRRLDGSSASIDRYSGRLGLLAKGLGALGPAAVPITASVVPALAMLTSGLSAAALGMGVTVTAFQGVGDALEAVNKAQLEPTAENITKAREAMQAISPAAREAVRAMQEWRPVLREIRDAAAGGFFPGFVDGLNQLESAAPQVERLFAVMGDASGDIFNDMAGWVSGPGGSEFLSFLEVEAPVALRKFAEATGNVGAGLAELMMAMDPLSDFGLDGLVGMTERFQQWADGLTQTDGYAEFIDYVRETGPQVVETIGSLANGILQVAEAAAPLGGPILQGIEAFADAVAAIADSPLGPPIMAGVTAMSALSLATKAFGPIAASSWMIAARGAQGYIAQMAAMRTAAMGVGKGAAIGGGLLLGTSDLGRSMEVSNTAMLASIGLMAGPWGAAAGGVVGSLLDIKAGSDQARDGIEAFNDALSSGDLDGAAARLDELREKQKDFQTQGLFGSDFGGPFLGSTLDNASDLWARLSGTAGDVADEVAAGDAKIAAAREKLAQAAGYASAAEKDYADALRDSADAQLAALDSALGYEGALRTMREEVKGVTGAFTANGQIQHGLTEEQQRAAETLLATGEAWGGLTAAQRRAAGGTKAARAEFVRTATQLGMSKKSANEYADSLFNIPPKRKTAIDLDSAVAMGKLTAFTALYGSIRSKTVTLTTQYAYTGKPSGGGAALDDLLLAPSQPRKRAAGGPIYGPGTATSDSIPAMLSNGEYVIRAAAVARYGVGFFDRANQMRLASGGSVGGRGGRDHGSAGVRSLGDESKKTAKELAKEREQRRKAREERARERAEDKVQRARSLLDERISERDQFGASVADRFRSDLFASQSRGSGWFTSSAPKSDWRSKMLADIAQAGEVNMLQGKLRGLGLDKGAAAALFADADVATLREFAGYSPEQIAEFEALFAERERLIGAAGAGAAQSAFGGGVASAQRNLRMSQAELAALRRRQRGRGPSREQRDAFRNRDRETGGRPRRGRGNDGDGGRKVDIWVQGDSSKDPIWMAAETARRLAFEGG